MQSTVLNWNVLVSSSALSLLLLFPFFSRLFPALFFLTFSLLSSFRPDSFFCVFFFSCVCCCSLSTHVCFFSPDFCTQTKQVCELKGRQAESQVFHQLSCPAELQNHVLFSFLTQSLFFPQTSVIFQTLLV